MTGHYTSQFLTMKYILEEKKRKFGSFFSLIVPSADMDN